MYLAMMAPRTAVIPKREGMNVKAGIRYGVQNEDDIFEFFEHEASDHGVLYVVERTHADADQDIIWRIIKAGAHKGKVLTGQLKSFEGAKVIVTFPSADIFQNLLGGLPGLCLSINDQLFVSEAGRAFWNSSGAHQKVYQDLSHHYGDHDGRCHFLFIITWRPGNGYFVINPAQIVGHSGLNYLRRTCGGQAGQ